MTPPFPLDPRAEAEINALLARLNLRQKVAFLSGRDFWRTYAVPELGICGVTVTDGPHGVRLGNELREGKNQGTATAFPTGTALAATWDTELIGRVGEALAEEARAAACDVLLGPCVNIIRTPVAGRNFETFSEDPYLSGKIGAAYVRGLQSRGVGASLKHFACNNQEYERTRGSSQVGERALREIYLAQFEMIVRESNPWTVMCSYNRINGEHASQNRRLLTDILKGEWGYTGVVVSDWNANHEVYRSVEAGLDLEMPGPAVYFGKLLEGAVKNWQLDESAVNDAVRRLLRLEKRVAAYAASHPDDRGSFSNDQHIRLAREASEASIVLLKNEGAILPLVPGTIQRIAVVGPTAPRASYGGGGSSVVPCAYTVSPLDGLRGAYGGRSVVEYAQGCEDRVKADSLAHVGLRVTHRGGEGFLQEVFANRTHSDDPRVSSCMEVDHWQIFLTDDDLDPQNFSIRWSGTMTPDRTGSYVFKFSYQGLFQFLIDDRPVEGDDDWHDRPPYPFYSVRKSAPVTLIVGQTYRVRLDLVNTLESERNAMILKAQYLISDAEVQAGIDAAVDLVRRCDRTIVVVGHPTGYEQEGIDRDDLTLPGAQNRLVEAVLAADPRAVVVLNTGAPVEMPWEHRAAAIVQAHFFGQEGGNALASVISGTVNPSGRLTATYPRHYADNPTFDTYPGGRTVEYREGLFVGYRFYDHGDLAVLFPFGHGLSYTRFEYRHLELTGSLADGPVTATVTVANCGGYDGTEVVQVYVADEASSEPRPVKELKGFQRVFVPRGEEAVVQFSLDPRAFAFYSERLGRWVVEAGVFRILVGASSRDLRLEASVTAPDLALPS